jgi:hypothetical protein
MRKYAVVLSIIMLAAMALALPAQAGKRVALVIGNAAYTSPEFSPLKSPVNDARAVAEKLRFAGFDVKMGLDVDKGAFGELVDSFFTRAKGADVALFYFSGHGGDYNNVNYLIPVDGRPGMIANDINLSPSKKETQLLSEAMKVDYVLSVMNDAGASAKVAIIDACRVTMGKSSSGGPVLMKAPVGSLVVYGTSPGTIAADGGTGEYSAFTESLLACIESDKEFESMITEVTADLYKKTKGVQIPYKTGNLISSFKLFESGTAPSAAPGTGLSLTGSKPGLATGNANLIVEASVRGAEIWVGGERKGVSGELIKGLPAGRTLVIEARAPGYYGKAEASLEANKTLPISIAMDVLKGELFIKPSEREARVFLDGKELGPIGNGLFVGIPHGTHELRLEGNSASYSGKVEVIGERTIEVAAILVAYGSLKLDAPAEVRLECEAKGLPPVALMGGETAAKIAAGSYTYRASGPGYEESRGSLVVKRAETTTLRPYSGGWIACGALPEGASVKVTRVDNGRLVATLKGRDSSPLLEPGEYRIAAEAPNHDGYESSLKVELGKSALFSASLKPHTGDLRIEAPKGAVISLKGPKGAASKATPGLIEGLPVGRYEISIGGDGIVEAKGSVTIAKGGTAIFAPYPTGELVLSSRPSPKEALLVGPDGDVRIRIDSGQSTFNLTPGRYRLRIKNPGYKDYESKDLVVEAGRVLKHEASLVKLSAAMLEIDAPEGFVVRLDGKAFSGGAVDAGVQHFISYDLASSGSLDKGLRSSLPATLTLGEGEARRIVVPRGYLALPALPKAASIFANDGSAITIHGTRIHVAGLDFPSNGEAQRIALAPGRYKVSYDTAFNGSEEVTISEGEIARLPALERSALEFYQSDLDGLEARKAAALRARNGQFTASWVSAGLGALAAAGAGLCWYLGDQARADYLAAGTSALATEARARVELFGTLVPILGGAAGAGLGLWPILGATAPPAPNLDDQIIWLEKTMRAIRGEEGK